MWLKKKHMKSQHSPSQFSPVPTKFQDFENSYGCKYLMQYVINALHVVLLNESKGLRGKKKEENS